MQIGKGTRDFEAYVRNLRHALAVSSVGSQLSAGENRTPIRRTMVHNPYVTTIADMGMCQYRTGPARALGQR